MSYLPPWPKATVTVPSTFEFFGSDTVLYTEIRAVLPDGVEYIRRQRGWDAITEEKAVTEGYGRQFRVPVIDPDGWIDQDDRPAAAWSYVVKVRATAEGRSPVSWSATLSPTSAVLITLDLAAGTLTGVATSTGTPTVDPKTGVIALQGGSSRPSLRGGRTIILGDSIDANTQGWFAYWSIESEQVPVLRNAAIGGQTTGQMLARIQADVLDYSPDIVILGGSTNDQGQGVAEAVTRGNIINMIEAVVKSGATPVLRTTPPVDIAGAVAPWDTVISRRKAVQRHNSWLKMYAGKNGIQVLDIYAASVNPFSGGYKTGYSDDGLHPNETGSKGIADWLITNGTPSVFNGTFALGRVFNEDGNLVTNGIFHDTDANGLADQWYFTVGTATGTTSVTAGTNGVVGNWQRITGTGAEAVAITHDIVRGTGTYALGDVLELSARIRTSGGASARLQMMAYGGSGTIDAVYNATKPISGGIVTQRMVPTDEANLRVRLIVQVNAGTAGWMELAELSVRNLTRAGLV